MADEGQKSGAVNGQESDQQPNPDELTKFVSATHLHRNKNKFSGLTADFYTSLLCL